MELKPCPFKHDEAYDGSLDIWHMSDGFDHVICYICGTQGPGADTNEEAAEAWNRRA